MTQNLSISPKGLGSILFLFEVLYGGFGISIGELKHHFISEAHSLSLLCGALFVVAKVVLYSLQILKVVPHR
jgi:hypothetical protein